MMQKILFLDANVIKYMYQKPTRQMEDKIQAFLKETLRLLNESKVSLIVTSKLIKEVCGVLKAKSFKFIRMINDLAQVHGKITRVSDRELSKAEHCLKKRFPGVIRQFDRKDLVHLYACFYVANKRGRKVFFITLERRLHMCLSPINVDITEPSLDILRN